jgi:predicted nucleic acid-binding protein
MSQDWLVDKSAYARIGISPDVDAWLGRVNRGLVRISTLTLLEIGYSVRPGDSWRATMSRPPMTSMPVQNITPGMESRALEVQGLLAERGHHRAPSIPDLLIAATAELAGLTVLHVDKDFELIAEVTGQPVERLAGDF